MTIRKAAKVAQNTAPQGQGKGQLFSPLAAKHHVSKKWLRLISEGALDDPACVQAIREAAKTTKLWELVAVTVRNALILPTVKIERLGGSIDDLLVMLLDSIALLRHPANRNFASHSTPLQHVEMSLDVKLQDQHDAIIQRGRINIKSIDTAHEEKTAKADDRARRWLEIVASKKGKLTKRAACSLIARNEKMTGNKKITVEAVEQAIKRYLKRRSRRR